MLDAHDARTVKLMTRTGMGWCQGRVCGYATAQLTARACGRDLEPGDLLTFAQRAFAAPVPLGRLGEVPSLGEEGDESIHIG